MQESKIIKSIVNILIKKPLLFLSLGLMLCIALTYGATRLTTNFSYRIWFTEDNPKLKVFDAFERKFGSDEIGVVVLHSPSGIFDQESASTLIKLTEDLWQAPEVIRVDSLSNFNWTHADGDEIIVEPLIPDDEELTPQLLQQRKQIALNHNTINGYLTNNEATTALFFISLKPSLNGTPDYETVVTGLRKIIKKYEGKSDHILYLTGTPTLNHAFKESAQEDMATLMPFVLLMVIIFLIINFRRISGVTIPLVIVTVTIMALVGLTGWINIEMNNLTSIVPQFMIAIALAVSVHLLVNFFSFFSTGLTKEQALQLSLKKNFRPTLLTCISTAIGFFSFSTSGIPPIAEMGIMAGYGTLLSWLMTYLFISPIILLAPIKQNKKESLSNEKGISPLSMKSMEVIFKYRKLIILISILVAISSFMLALKTEVNSDPFNYFDPKYHLSIANSFVEDNVGGSTGAEIIINSGVKEGIKDPVFLKNVEKFQNWIDKYPFVTKTVSIVNILKEMNQALNGGKASEYKLPESRESIAQQLFLYTMNLPQGMDLNNRMTIENDSLRLTAMWTIHSSKKVLEIIDDIENKAKEFDLNATVTGKLPLYHSNNEKVVESFIKSLTIALILVALLLCWGLKSIRLGFLSILPNALPLIIGGGVLYLMGQSLDIGTVIVCSICLGIAVDDTIHFLANFKIYKDEGLNNKMAVAKIFTHTAPALITTTLVLVAAFATFTFATFVPNQNFGELVAIILSVALIADLTFLPALVMTFDFWEGKKKGQ